MTRGFYILGSGMITQNKVLSGISNNIANQSTPGYRKTKVIPTAFEQMVINRVDGQVTPLGNVSMVRVADEAAKIHSQGNLDSTDRALDFAILGEGFFGIEGGQYTRDGSFNVDNQGFLTLEGKGRVLGTYGPIRITNTDNYDVNKLKADEKGNIYNDGNLVGTLAIYNFEDYNGLQMAGEGMFTGGNPNQVQPNIKWKTIETSNVSPGDEMTDAIGAMRHLQACAQALKMYDQAMAKAVSEIGRV